MTEKHTNLEGEDIRISLCAKEECVAGKQVDFYAEDERNYYALHFITYGNGAIKIGDGKEQILKPGDIFIIPPDKRVRYRTIDRWVYYWVNLEGKQVLPFLKSIGLDKDNLVVNYKRNSALSDLFSNMVNCYYEDGDVVFKGKGYLYLIMGLLYDDIHKKVSDNNYKKRGAEFYIKEATTFLEFNYYYTGVTLESLANNLSVNKNYLCAIFKKHFGMSPIQYLIKLRMDAACRRLIEKDEPIASVAQYVGYKDALYFSKEFKKYTEMSPSQFRIAKGKIS